MKLFLNYLLLLCFLAPATISSLDDVPGCNCPGTNCVPRDGHTWNPHPFVCLLEPWSIDSVVLNETPDPICDTIWESPEFQDAYGRNSPEWYTGSNFGPFYEHSKVSGVVGIGTCEEALASQSNCTVPDSPSFGIIGSIGIGSILNSCTGAPLVTPMNVSLAFYTACESWRNKDIINNNTPWKDNLEVYLFKMDNDDYNTCDSIASSRLSPILTSVDWIEPMEGRRYMCKDIPSINGENIFILYFSIGNEPCSGPKPVVDDDDPNAAQRIGPSAMIIVLSMIVGGIIFV